MNLEYNFEQILTLDYNNKIINFYTFIKMQRKYVL